MRLKFPIHPNHVLCDGGVLGGGEGYAEGSNELNIKKILASKSSWTAYTVCHSLSPEAMIAGGVVKRTPKVCSRVSRASMPVVAEVRDYLARCYPKPSVDPVCLQHTCKNASLTWI